MPGVANIADGHVANDREGVIKSSDSQAELLAGVTGGWLSPRDVGRALAPLLATTIEFVSAFGTTVLSSYGEATERRYAMRRDEAPAETAVVMPAQAPKARFPGFPNTSRIFLV